MARPISAGWFRWFYIDQHPEITRDPEHCQAMCYDDSWYVRVREWQCKRQHRVTWYGFQLCRPHARRFETLYEIEEGPDLNLKEFQQHYLVQQEKRRLESGEARRC